MLKEILKPKWRNPDPEQRIKALSELNFKDPNDELAVRELAEHDESELVRKAAIGYVKDIALLQKLHQEDKEESVRQASEERMITLLSDTEENTFSFDARCEFLKSHGQEAWMGKVITKVARQDLRQFVLDNIDNPQIIARIAISDPIHEMRNQALQKLTDIEALNTVVKETRNKDKGLHKQAQQRLEKIKAEQERPQQLEAEWEAIQNSLRYLEQVDRWNTPELEQLRSLGKRWQAIEPEMTAEAKETYEKAYAACEKHYQDYVQAQKEREEQQQQQIHFCEELEEFIQQYPTLDELTTEKIEEYRQQWQALAVDDLPLQARFNKGIKALEDRLNRLQKQQDSQETLAELLTELESNVSEQKVLAANELKRYKSRWQDIEKQQEVSKDLQERFDKAHAELQQRLEQHQVQIKKTEETLKQVIEELETAVAAGEVHPAEQKKQSYLQLRSKLPPSNPVRKHAEKQLRHLDGKLKELKSWQEWGSIQAREALCDKMDQLVGMELHPEELHKEIRSLQEEWKRIDKLDTASGRKLWPRFNGAMQKAYEPCKSYFEEQAKVKQAHYEEGIAFCDKLDAFYETINWDEKQDWPSIDKTAQEYRQGWRKLGDMRPKDRRTLEKRYRNVMKELDKRLDEERKRNIEEKEDLIAQAQTLQEMEDLGAAINKAKDLQKMWNTTVSAKPSQERKMREKFKAACDIVFDRRREQHAEREKVRQDLIDSKKTILDSVIALTTADVEASDEIKTQLKDLQEQWEASEPLEKEQRTWDTKFANAAKKVDKHLRKLEKAGQVQGLHVVQEKSEVLAAFEAGIEDREALKARWTELAAMEDSELEEAFQARMQEAEKFIAGEINEQDWQKRIEENTHEARQLCVRLEILTGLESPKDAQQERMQYQVARLSMAMQQKPVQKMDNDPLKLLQDFYVLGPVDKDQYENLFTRMEKVQEKVFG